ncbi:hypothetical protein BGW41_004516 [Actinomortierella wolfii]|nr:hypothetical protein BGW41_004516 [Actinomortierella wolfii]
MLLNEKRRRRRESHNAVERRRRDNINEKIQELSTLLPDTYIDSANKPNKGVILRKSVDYIRHLQQLVASQTSRNQELEAQLRMMNGGNAQESNTNGNGQSSTHTNGNTDSMGVGGTPSSDAGSSAQLHQGFGMMRIVGGEGNTPTNL